MTFDMKPEPIILHGHAIRERIRAGHTVVTRYSPGNMTCYELSFIPTTAVAVWTGAPGEFDGHKHLNDCLIAKSNGSLTWSMWLPICAPDGGYWDPGYLATNMRCTAGDVHPLGLLINAVAGRAPEDLPAYLDHDEEAGTLRISRPSADVIALCDGY